MFPLILLNEKVKNLLENRIELKTPKNLREFLPYFSFLFALQFSFDSINILKSLT